MNARLTVLSIALCLRFNRPNSIALFLWGIPTGSWNHREIEEYLFHSTASRWNEKKKVRLAVHRGRMKDFLCLCGVWRGLAVNVFRTKIIACDYIT